LADREPPPWTNEELVPAELQIPLATLSRFRAQPRFQQTQGGGNGLMLFLNGLKKVFLVHGEAEQQSAFAEAIHSTYGVDVLAPERSSSFEL